MSTIINPTLPGDHEQLTELADKSYTIATGVVEAAAKVSRASGPLRCLAINSDDAHLSVCTTEDPVEHLRASAQNLRKLADQADALADQAAGSDALQRHIVTPS